MLVVLLILRFLGRIASLSRELREPLVAPVGNPKSKPSERTMRCPRNGIRRAISEVSRVTPSSKLVLEIDLPIVDEVHSCYR